MVARMEEKFLALDSEVDIFSNQVIRADLKAEMMSGKYRDEKNGFE